MSQPITFPLPFQGRHVWWKQPFSKQAQNSCCKYYIARFDYLTAQILRLASLAQTASSTEKETFEDQIVRLKAKLDQIEDRLLTHTCRKKKQGLFSSFVAEM
jgi:hypothetical protein